MLTPEPDPDPVDVADEVPVVEAARVFPIVAETVHEDVGAAVCAEGVEAWPCSKVDVP